MGRAGIHFPVQWAHLLSTSLIAMVKSVATRHSEVQTKEKIRRKKTAVGRGRGGGGGDGQGRDAMRGERRHAASDILRGGQYGTVMVT